MAYAFLISGHGLHYLTSLTRTAVTLEGYIFVGSYLVSGYSYGRAVQLHGSISVTKERSIFY